ncbi:hypothetical protein C8R46DRAFT_309394 [Mycena filopes]|nr:hypothetical protein C8R46DRAFT_309394 [Mycena filopes]
MWIRSCLAVLTDVLSSSLAICGDSESLHFYRVFPAWALLPSRSIIPGQYPIKQNVGGGQPMSVALFAPPLGFTNWNDAYQHFMPGDATRP